MDCGKAKQMMDDLLDSDLDEVGRSLVEQHLAECATCARDQSEMRAVEQWGRDLAPLSSSARFTDRVMARVETERPVRETSTAGIEMLIAFVVAAAVVPIWLTAGETVYDSLVGVIGWTGDLFGSVAADLIDLGNQTVASLGEFWSATGEWQRALSPVGVALLAAAALLAMVVFNFVQARAASHSMGRRA